jgi:aldose 1-epimerase
MDMALAAGFYHCYVLRKVKDSEHPVREVARVYEPGSGRELSVLTDQWGLQFYTGNHLEGEQGRSGHTYSKYAGLCLEAGGFRNQINMADNAQVVLRPGMEYRHVTQYRVGVRTGV